ncbi:MAG: glycerol-3-phosphate responsive antiterminator [Chloroflexi bacterium]|nr:glycerol-3-phosphate responsive antiterminator [Chloroflexota bacterium]MBV9602613.1 glycerol-3-phosphate responsive antiterminator [Chloroflexota bacterium]
MPESWLSELRRRPIIAAVRDEAALGAALASPAAVIFLLSGSLLNIEQMVRRVRREERAAFVHLDLVEGLTKDQHGLRWLAQRGQPTGIISTRGSVLAAAGSMGLATVQRLFLLDSQSVRTGLELANNVRPDVVEVLPGILPGAIADILHRSGRPVIAGGMITSQQQVCAALEAGAYGVSASNHQLWEVDLDARCRSRQTEALPR